MTWAVADSRGRWFDASDYTDIERTGQWWSQMGWGFDKCARLILKEVDGCQWVRPQHWPLDAEDLQSLQKTMQKAERFFSVPLVIETDYLLWKSRHTVQLIFVKKEGSVVAVEFFDPKGYTLPAAATTVADALAGPNTQIVSKEGSAFQWLFDSVSCGPNSLYFLEQRLRRGIPLDQIEPPPMGIIAYRADLAERLADQCVFPDPQEPPIADDWVLVEDEGESNEDPVVGAEQVGEFGAKTP
jgi:hypothetical protein